jgi:hypothetical protein
MTFLGTGFGDRFKVFRGDGKEGVDGSSPSEGLSATNEVAAKDGFLLPPLAR